MEHAAQTPVSDAAKGSPSGAARKVAHEEASSLKGLQEDDTHELTALHDWLLDNEMPEVAFARQVGCHTRSVRFWRYGASIPNTIFAILIERLTGGAVPVTYWITTQRGKQIMHRETQAWDGVRPKQHSMKKRKRAIEDVRKARTREHPDNRTSSDFAESEE